MITRQQHIKEMNKQISLFKRLHTIVKKNPSRHVGQTASEIASKIAVLENYVKYLEQNL